MRLVWAPLSGLLLAVVLALFTGRAVADANAQPDSKEYTYYSIGDAPAAHAAGTRAAMLLLGGGEWPMPAIRDFISAAGKGHIVILRASGDDEAQLDFWRNGGGPRAVSTVVFHSRQAAFDPNVIRLLQSADGIFIAGGDQANYIRYWDGTPVQTAMNEHVRAGRPIAGTSAGLAILGRHAYGCLDGDSMDSPRALANPLRSGLTLWTGLLTLPGLEHVLTDSHFSERHRLGRLVSFLARLAHDQPATQGAVIGLGIDEESGLWIEPTGEARVVSRKQGAVWWVKAGSPAANLEQGKPLAQSGIEVVRLGTDSEIQLTVGPVGSDGLPTARWTWRKATGHFSGRAEDGVLELTPTPAG
jgi:beta-aspartyl-peptidase (threonine type)